MNTIFFYVSDNKYMKARDFNIINIKDKYDFKDSEDLIVFLEKTLKERLEDKEHLEKLLNDVNDQHTNDKELIKDNDYLDFINKAKTQIQKRLNKVNTSIKVLKNDIDIVVNQINN